VNKFSILRDTWPSIDRFTNGADDMHVPQLDTLVFEGRPNTGVRLSPDTGHGALSKLPEVMRIMIGWLRNRLARRESTRVKGC